MPSSFTLPKCKITSRRARIKKIYHFQTLQGIYFSEITIQKKNSIIEKFLNASLLCRHCQILAQLKLRINVENKAYSRADYEHFNLKSIKTRAAQREITGFHLTKS